MIGKIRQRLVQLHKATNDPVLTIGLTVLCLELGVKLLTSFIENTHEELQQRRREQAGLRARVVVLEKMADPQRARAIYLTGVDPAEPDQAEPVDVANHAGALYLVEDVDPRGQAAEPDDAGVEPSVYAATAASFNGFEPAGELGDAG